MAVARAIPRRVHDPQLAKVATLAEMVADPCGSQLTAGLYGSSEGMLAKLKRSAVVQQVASDTCGYIMWDPEFATDRSDNGSAGNLVIWSANDPSVRPSNSTTFPFGESAAGGRYAADPAAQLLKTDLVSDMRTLCACLQLTYTGSLLNASGEICYITNLPAQELLTGGPANTTLSVDELFAYASHKERLSPETHEVIYRPTQSGHIFRNEDDELFTAVDSSNASISPVAKVIAPKVIGMAWRGVTAGSALTYDVTKGIEWRAEASSGLGQTVEVSAGATKVPVVTQALDSHPAKIWHGVKRLAHNSGASAVSGVFGHIAQTASGTYRKHKDSLFKMGGDFMASHALEMLPMLLGAL